MADESGPPGRGDEAAGPAAWQQVPSPFEWDLPLAAASRCWEISPLGRLVRSGGSLGSARMDRKPRALLLNGDRLDFDSSLDLSPLRRVVALDVRRRTGEHEVGRVARGYEVLITKEIAIDKCTMASIDGVRLICEAGTGYDKIDVAAASANGITVCNVPAYSTASVAQLTMSFVLGIASGTLHLTHRSPSANRKDFVHLPCSPFEVTGKKLGVIGPGEIGREVTFRAIELGMRVVTAGRSPRKWSHPHARVPEVDLKTLLQTSDFVSLHCPLIDGPSEQRTRHLMNRKTLARMSSTSWLINTSRGGLVHEADLIDAVRTGRIAGAAVDVREEEPPRSVLPASVRNRMFLTPHVGWKTIEARQRLISTLAQVLRAYRRHAPINTVRPQ